ncbi:hypothetical protein OKA05_13240 [Luteolibacter arcticus]|uniref:Polysaccharide biosynthesis protein n=1 Tax=Luteolibacter arcticus TaxID=1581411 RepID=A0ABT3GJ18_9BACT|nr:hypothetical protein [Luteolibacter arcticus]MCW1923523.1 hypothetical protein [Luteolibacter arcticus]
MNHKGLLARGVLLGYGALGAQVFYSFASIPLALAYLGKAEFALWSVISALVGYLSLAEAGMTNSFLRHLFECKGDQESGKYGRYFAAGLGALGLVALVMLAAGSAAAWVSPQLIGIPSDLRGIFVWVMLGQVAVSAVTMATRMLGAPLYIHHRQDLLQVCQIGLFVVYYTVLHLGFKAGWGIYAMLANQGAGLVWSISFNVIACVKLRLFPARGSLGLPTREEWNSVWAYSRDQFVIQVGGIVANGLPALLLPRLLGLEAVAVWAVCTRPFGIVRQLVVKPYDVALPMFCDIYVRGEKQQLTKRWTDVTQLVLAIAGCAFVVAAANNESFLALWTGGRMTWGVVNDWLWALKSYVSVAAVAAFGIVGIEKAVGRTKYVPFVESALMIALALVFVKFWGMGGLILATTLPQIFGSLWSGVSYLGRITGHSRKALLWNAILRPTFVLPLAIAAACGATLLTRTLPGYYGLMVSAAVGSAIALLCVAFLGVSPEVRDEIRGLVVRSVRRFLPSRRPAAATSEAE